MNFHCQKWRGWRKAPKMFHVWNVKLDGITVDTPPKTNMDTHKIMVWKRWLLLNMAIFGIYVRFLRCILEKIIPKESASRPILLGQTSERIHTLHASEIRRSPPNIATFSKYQLVFFHHQQYRSCRSHTNWPNWPPLKKPIKNWQNPAGLRPRVGLKHQKTPATFGHKKLQPPSCIRSLS